MVHSLIGAEGGWQEWPEGLRALRYASAEFMDKSPRELLAEPGAIQ